MKVRDTDYLYATMNIRANEKKLLNSRGIERMIEAKTPEEVSKILSEFGYGQNALLNIDDVEAAIQSAEEETVRIVSDACDNDSIKNVFLLKYDFHNIKVITKANFTHQDAENLLSGVSLIPGEKLLSMIKDGDLSSLPEKMRAAYMAAAEVLAHTGNAELSDYILDEACFDMMTDTAKESGSEFLLGYVKLLADIANLRLAVRMIRRGKEEDIEARLLSFGGIAKEKFLRKNLSEELSTTHLARAAELGEVTAKGEASFAEFERELDTLPVKYMQEAKYVAFDERPIVAYLASREADAVTVRIIMSGKIMGLSPDEIRSRLRVV